MRRKISFILALIIIFTAIPFISLAQDYDKQLEEAILKSKKLFNIGSEYDNFTHSVSSYNGTTVFYLNWSDKDEKLGYIEVSITVDGTVLSYSKWKPSYGEDRPKLPKVSKEEGLKKANDFINKVSPEFAKSIKYIDNEELLNVNSDRYYYNFVRTYNGIPYYNNTIDISVDNITGEVVNYYANWQFDLKFQDANNIISLEESEKLYKEKIGLELLYKSAFVKDKEKTFLVYAPLNTNLGINAKDGEVISFYDYIGIYDRGNDMGGAISKEAELSPDERKAVEGIQGIISKEKAEKIAKDTLKLDSGYKLDYISLYNEWNTKDKYFWQMSFSKGTDNDSYYASASIDAKTGDIIYLYKYNPTSSDKKVKYNQEESLNIAKEFINRMEPDKVQLIELNENIEDVRPLKEQRSYYFNFIRKVDNAYVQNEGIYITVDAVNGEIAEYRIEWSDKEFPSQDNTIAIDKAYEVLFDDIGLELKYIRNEGYGNENEAKEAILVYGLKQDKPINIDAYTGNILNYNGEIYNKASVISYKDIDSSYAKEKINILAKYGISLPGEEFRPKEKIIQKDFLYLLAKANSPYMEIDDVDSLYSYLIRMNIVKEDEKAPERIVTKEEAVKYIIRAMNYDEIADLTQIYKDLFKDTGSIDPKLKGYVAIAYGLNIVQGDNGYLNPKAQLNREDAANMIYNYLFNGSQR